MRTCIALVAVSALSAASALAGCAASPDAIAKIEARSSSVVVGSAVFRITGEMITMDLAVDGLTPGNHGVHVHEKGDCSAADGTSAGGHWNPAKAMHGAPNGAAHHSGDMGNLVAGEDGHAALSFSTADWTIGAATSSTSEVIGRAIIIHGKPDDFSQPAGNAGPRVGCGVVVVAAE